MATTAASVGQQSFSIGAVLSQAFGTLGSNPVATFGIAFLFGALPQTVFSYFIGSDLRMADRASTVAVIVVSLASYAVYLLLSMLVQGALVRATTAHAQGQKARFAECVGTGLTMAVPLIGLTILMLLGLMAGFALFLVPGIMLFMMWSVAVPALVDEQIGIFAAFGRSRFLTKGARWKIFGLFLLVMVLGWLLLAAVGALTLAGGIQSVMTGADFRPGLAYQIVSLVSNTLILAFWGAVQPSLYIGLRNWKDGPQGNQLADIFA